MNPILVIDTNALWIESDHSPASGYEESTAMHEPRSASSTKRTPPGFRADTSVGNGFDRTSL